MVKVKIMKAIKSLIILATGIIFVAMVISGNTYSFIPGFIALLLNPICDLVEWFKSILEYGEKHEISKKHFAILKLYTFLTYRELCDELNIVYDGSFVKITESINEKEVEKINKINKILSDFYKGIDTELSRLDSKYDLFVRKIEDLRIIYETNINLTLLNFQECAKTIDELSNIFSGLPKLTITDNKITVELRDNLDFNNNEYFLECCKYLGLKITCPQK
jgi:hypothetical protein